MPLEVGKEYDRNDLLKQLHHIRHKSISWCRADKTFMVNVDGEARRLPGIHSIMDAFCEPPDNSTLAAFRRKQTAPLEWQAYCKYAHETDERGKEGGTIVHHEMDIYVKEGKRGLLNRVPHPHRYTLRLIEFIEKNCLVPLLAEFLVYDELHLGFATRVDMIVFNPRDNAFEVWEVKTGYEKVFAISDGTRMYGPLRPHFENSHLSRALLQALFAKMALKFRYGLDLAARVVLVNNEGVMTKILPRTVLQSMPLLYKECGKHLREVRRKQEKKNVVTIQKIDLRPAAAVKRALYAPIAKSTKEELSRMNHGRFDGSPPASSKKRRAPSPVEESNFFKKKVKLIF